MPNPNTDAPKAIRDLLVRFGGKNPYGKPNWRLCLAQNRMVIRAGVFCTLEGGEACMFTVGAGGRVDYQPMKADRVESFAQIEVPLYPHVGWIMERWLPPHVWGTKEEWTSHKSSDGTPMMGPYPVEGDFFMINGPFEKRPDWGDMENAIAHYENTQRIKPVDMANALRMQIKDKQDAHAKRVRKLEEEIESFRRQEILPMLRSTSLAAQGVRQMLQRMVGQASHLPAGCA